MNRSYFYFLSAFIWLCGCASDQKRNSDSTASTVNTLTFSADVDFLKQFTEIVVLQDASGQSKVAISPALQGRVMTSTSGGDQGLSYGWINRSAFLSGDTSKHINVFGGEDRFWLGPEGGQFSIYFSNGKEFTLDNWYVPRLIDLELFDKKSVSDTAAVFVREAKLVNYSETVFAIAIERKIRLIERNAALRNLGLENDEGLSLVAFESINTLRNLGAQPWKKETGLLSIWILGMFNPSPATTVIVPYRGKQGALRDVVNDNYFGAVPDARLKHNDKVVFFKGDGQYRTKIGFSAERAGEWLGSYDANSKMLTLVKYNKPDQIKDYVNAAWELQKEPYKGDVVNSYNDGPPSPGAKPLGPFYELETSSPAAALKQFEDITHVHSTYHVQGEAKLLDPIMKRILGVTTSEVVKAFQAY